MKTLILSLTLTITSFSANAGITNDDIKYCKTVETIAKAIMEQRQLGNQMSNIVDALSKPETIIIQELGVQFAQEAFSHPLYNAPENQAKAVIEFANQKFLMCINTYAKDSGSRY